MEFAQRVVKLLEGLHCVSAWQARSVPVSFLPNSKMEITWRECLIQIGKEHSIYSAAEQRKERPLP